MSTKLLATKDGTTIVLAHVTHWIYQEPTPNSPSTEPRIAVFVVGREGAVAAATGVDASNWEKMLRSRLGS